MSGRRGRRAVLAVVVVAAAAGTTAGGLAMARSDGSDEASATTGVEASAPRRTTTVERRDLVATTEVDGTVGYGDPRPVRGTGAGTITSLPEPGAVVEHDQPLYEVDGRAGPIVLPGGLPLWRPLEAGVDDGADVAQLEAALVALGYADAELTVDEELSWLTTDAIEAWQEAHGLEVTGRITPGDVWYSATAVRVASTTAAVGDPAQGEVLALTGTERRVDVDLEVDASIEVAEGDAVDLELADGTAATGTVTAVADAATVTPGEGQEATTTTVAVEIAPEGELDAPDQSPVTVSFVRDAVEDALAVPLEAVVATSGGGFALEVVAGDGTTDLVEVELGRLADGWVQVTGDVAAGDTVVTA